MRGISRAEDKAFSGKHASRGREKEYGERHTIAVRRATQFSNAPRPPRKEKSFTQVVAQYVDAWLKDRDSRRLVKGLADACREVVHRAGDVAILKHHRRALDRFGDDYAPALHAALREQLRDDRA
ncbi:hypothetical protein [Burkholderia cepacia]|uniref:hypothetical protein n=1 Tax=Burkholderia cepacia TaxID=292 RepID=UPI00158C6323|nr:hypothetical protein [Burkholderia cepacia]